MFSGRQADENTNVRVGVGVFIRDSAGRILLEKRRDCGLWGLPGGKIEPGERVEQCAIREVAEETGLSVRITRLIGVYSDPAEHIATYPNNGEVVHLIDILLEAEILGGNLDASDESEQVAFFDLDALPAELVPPALSPIRNYRAGITGVIN
jgi:ADP-ribose pyrophosphatase YjhB (NUDIX family)